VKAYVTGTSLKNLKTAHCIVNLYKSVSKKEMTPSGNGDELLKSILAAVASREPVAYSGGGSFVSIEVGKSIELPRSAVAVFVESLAL
jgi:hypothetical protein